MTTMAMRIKWTTSAVNFIIKPLFVGQE